MPAEVLQNGIPQIPSKIRFHDFAPDLDPMTPGALLDMSNVYPTQKGWRTYPGLTRYSSNGLFLPCLGAWAGLIGDTFVVAAGTAEQLRLLVTTEFMDQGLTLTTMTEERWRFDVYSGLLIAVNGLDAAWSYDGTGTFDALAGSPPVASIVQATGYSLFLIEPNSSDWISTLNPILWTPSIATQTVTGTLNRGEGNITAAHKIRGGIVLYKRNHMSMGRFTGPPHYWDFGDGVSDKIGTYGQECVANLGDVHYFPGPDDFYSFDGSSLTRVPNNLKEWFFARLDQSRAHKIAARSDLSRSLIFWHFPTVDASPAGSLNAWICYNLKTGKWSCDLSPVAIDMPIFVPVTTGQLTYDSLTQTYPTYGDMSFTYGDLRSRNVDISGVIVSEDHTLHLFNGNPGEASLTTHDFGDRESLFQITKVRPDYTVYPEDGATIQPLSQLKKPGTTPVAGTVRALSEEGDFNVMSTARLQRFKHTSESDCEIVGVKVDAEFAGEA